MGIRRMVSQLTRNYGTNNPFTIAKQKNILVVYEPLGGVMGYFNTYKRMKMIHLNNSLDEIEMRFTCSHELGHALLHPKVNTPFLKRHTLFSVDRIEREANQFAAELLIPDELLLEHTISEAAAICGIPEQMARFKRFYK
ncbi:ImmA/IrrE family metallo-endopeptidase [Paenibacillus alkaliterrae]|uniref:ImmA/IrrE family metallo-endopeptidase n=1 Tax=Paenibacillus alkaliterrae TaxID=320909 RepID=UPI001F2FA0BA|nr:ImmA/IrrE family metallo-endopeptidase [Paenibacillus alkaliterrae]MCF2939005.1 ImmA/IrrE family metallo-endopeptidase [Paenibacillus alkaliterrae]